MALGVKKLPANAGDTRDVGLIPGLGRSSGGGHGKILWRRAWQPTPVILPGESHGESCLEGYTPCGHKELDTTEAT